MFFDWNEMERGKKSAVESAKRADRGLPREHLIPGSLVTISPCKCTGDRSYSHSVWEVLATNEGHASIRKFKPSENDCFAGPHIVSIYEHEFYGAEHLVAS